MRTDFIVLFAHVIVGFSCFNNCLAKNSTCQDDEKESVENYIAAWSDMGFRLPDDEQLGFFRANVELTLGPLRDALVNRDENVRSRAAYVVEQLGPEAIALGPTLLERIVEEDDRKVRMYIVSALLATGFSREESREAISHRYEALDAKNVPATDEFFYAGVDEKIALAAALYSLSDDDAKVPYLDFVTSWLKPTPPGLKGPLLEGYWNRRWMSVNRLKGMRGAASAIPLLESLREAPDAPSWVDVHIPRVINALRDERR